MKIKSLFLSPSGAIVTLNLIDLLAHIIAGIIMPLIIIGNILMITAALIVIKFSKKEFSVPLVLSAIGIYLLLNIIYAIGNPIGFSGAIFIIANILLSSRLGRHLYRT